MMDPLQSPAPPRLHRDWHYHFLGIGGVGMSALAAVLHGLGYRVSGSDAHDSVVLRGLAACGISVRVGHDAEALRDAQAVVYTTALPASHAIWGAVRSLGLARLHRAEVLGALSRERRTVAVSGTHGKTTTAAVLAWVLQESGDDPTALIGGHVPQLAGRNYRLGSSDWLVVEADESDGSFVHIAPQAIAVTNIEDDHLDHHGSAERLQGAFRAFLGRLSTDGVLVYCRDDALLTRMAACHGGYRIAYGLHAEADVRVERTEPAGRPGSGNAAPPGMPLMQAILAHEGRRHVLPMRIPGLHNAVNLAGVFAMTCALGLPQEAVLRALATFSGVARRQQLVGEAGGLRIFDDYAHHPTEIRATLAAFHELYGGELTVVFQPHLYSRTARFAARFAAALRPAGRVIVTDVYAAREQPQPGVSGRLIVDALAGHADARFVPTWQDAAEALTLRRPRGILLTMGAGDITELGPYLLRAWGHG